MFCSGLRSLAIPPLYLLYLPPLSDCAGSAVVKMDAQFIAARERLLRPQRGPTARCLLWPGWLNDVRCRARAQHHVARGVCERARRGDKFSLQGAAAGFEQVGVRLPVTDSISHTSFLFVKRHGLQNAEFHPAAASRSLAGLAPCRCVAPALPARLRR